MKSMLKEMLEKNSGSASYLNDLVKKGATYDQIWYEKLYSEASILLFVIH